MSKRAYTPDSYNARVTEWCETDGAVYDTYPMRTPEELAARHINDAERVAVALLRDSRPTHVEIEAWVAKVASELTFMDAAPEVSYNYGTRKEVAIDEAIVRLGYAIQNHRAQGEEGHTDDGSPLTVGEVPPLAQAITRYHHEVVSAYAAELYRIKQGIN